MLMASTFCGIISHIGKSRIPDVPAEGTSS
jgi:hypothetical protein